MSYVSGVGIFSVQPAFSPWEKLLVVQGVPISTVSFSPTIFVPTHFPRQNPVLFSEFDFFSPSSPHSARPPNLGVMIYFFGMMAVILLLTMTGCATEAPKTDATTAPTPSRIEPSPLKERISVLYRFMASRTNEENTLIIQGLSETLSRATTLEDLQKRKEAIDLMEQLIPLKIEAAELSASFLKDMKVTDDLLSDLEETELPKALEGGMRESDGIDSNIEAALLALSEHISTELETQLRSLAQRIHQVESAYERQKLEKTLDAILGGMRVTFKRGGKLEALKAEIQRLEEELQRLTPPPPPPPNKEERPPTSSPSYDFGHKGPSQIKTL